MQSFFSKPTIRDLARLVDALLVGEDVRMHEPTTDELEHDAEIPRDILDALASMFFCDCVVHVLISPVGATKLREWLDWYTNFGFPW